MELQQEFVKRANNNETYDEIVDQIFALREKRQQASMDTVQRDEQLQRITESQYGMTIAQLNWNSASRSM